MYLDPSNSLVKAQWNISADFAVNEHPKVGIRGCSYLHNFKVLHVLPFRFDGLSNDIVLSGLSRIFGKGGLRYEGVGKGVC